MKGHIHGFADHSTFSQMYGYPMKHRMSIIRALCHPKSVQSSSPPELFGSPRTHGIFVATLLSTQTNSPSVCRSVKPMKKESLPKNKIMESYI